MHLIHVLGSLVYGGVESTALRFMRALAAHQYQQTAIVITDQRGERHEDFQKLENIPLIICHYDRKHRWGSIQRLTAEFRKLKPDAVYCYSFGPHLPVSIAAWKAGIKNVVTSVGGEPTRNWSTWWKCLIAAHLARPFCRGEIAVGRHIAHLLHKKLWLPRRRVTSIYNGVEVEDIFQRAESARKNKTTSDTWRLLKVSRMDDAKDHETLFQAVALLHRTGKKIYLRLAGTGPWMERTKELAQQLGIAEIVEFLGNRRDIPELMGEADVLVHSTFTEGLPTVLIEAMAAGVPIVATDIPQCRECLNDGKAGMLVPPRDPQGMAHAITALMHDPDCRMKLCQAGREHARSHFTMEEMVDSFRKVFEKKSWPGFQASGNPYE